MTDQERLEHIVRNHLADYTIIKSISEIDENGDAEITCSSYGGQEVKVPVVVQEDGEIQIYAGEDNYWDLDAEGFYTFLFCEAQGILDEKNKQFATVTKQMDEAIDLLRKWGDREAHQSHGLVKKTEEFLRKIEKS